MDLLGTSGLSKKTRSLFPTKNAGLNGMRFKNASGFFYRNFADVHSDFDGEYCPWRNDEQR